MAFEFRGIMPGDDEHAPYYQKYISVVPHTDILLTLNRQRVEMIGILSGLTDEKANFSYAPGKWTIKELTQHVIDTERVFSYRALCIARNEKTPLPSIEQDDYVKHSNANARQIKDMISEFDHLRVSTLDLLGSLDADAWLRRGTASNNPVSVRALAWIIAGHERHHAEILKTRYLQK